MIPSHAEATSAKAHERACDAIGVFDSGIGGLSVLRALRTELPLERFVYLADSGHAPYGERDDTHVICRSNAIARYMVEHHHIKTLVVACNTATATAITQLRQAHTGLPIVGIEPALKPAAGLSTTKRIGVMATRGTLNSAKFQALHASLNALATFVLQPCDGLADAIEREDATKIVAACGRLTGAMGTFGSKTGDMDTLVLGCTHYAFASDTLASLVGEQVALLEGGAPVARQTRRLLAERGWLASPDGIALAKPAALTCLTTGDPKSLQGALLRWLQLQTNVQSVVVA